MGFDAGEVGLGAVAEGRGPVAENNRWWPHVYRAMYMYGAVQLWAPMQTETCRCHVRGKTILEEENRILEDAALFRGMRGRRCGFSGNIDDKSWRNEARVGNR